MTFARNNGTNEKKNRCAWEFDAIVLLIRCVYLSQYKIEKETQSQLWHTI